MAFYLQKHWNLHYNCAKEEATAVHMYEWYICDYFVLSVESACVADKVDSLILDHRDSSVA